MSNIKDTLTTIAGVVAAVSTAIISAISAFPASVHVADWVTATVGILGAVSVAVIGFFNGKNADGSTKNNSQIAKQKQIKG